MLVLVLALGMVPLVASADNGFIDADDIEFVEAADVLKALGVIVGYTDGSYQPNQTVTRAEAVAYIVRMLLTPSAANRLPNNRSSFTDVLSNPSAAWAAGMIEYAYGEGIVYGRGEDLFDPQGSVTGIEMAAFLLRALGIGKYDNPATWAINAVADGTRIGILDIGDDVDLAAPAIRDQVGFYTFNALIHSDTEVTTTKTEYLVSAVSSGSYDTELADIFGELYPTFAAANNAVKDAEADAVIGKDYTITAVTVTETRKVGSIADELYGLTESETVIDAFGRPSRSWLYKGEAISSAATSAPVLTYTTGVSQETLFADLGLRANVTIATLKRNGETLVPKDQNILYNNTGTDSFDPSNPKDDNGFGGRGTLTEVYRASDGAITIIEVETFVGEITNVAAATAVARETVTVTAKELLDGDRPFVTETFAIAGLNVEDIVLFTVADVDGDFKIQSVKLAVTDTLTATSWTTRSFVADGRTYNYSMRNAGPTIGGTNAYDPTVVYFDDYNNVIMTKAPPAVDRYAYVLQSGAGVDEFGEDVYRARLVFADGTVETVLTDVEYASATYKDKIVTFDVIAGEYELTLANQAAKASIALSVVQGRSRIDWPATTGVYFGNARTLYIVATGPPANRSYTTYVGYTEVPSMSGSTTGVIAFTGTAANVVYVENPGAGVLTDIIFVSRANATLHNLPGTGNNFYRSSNVMVNGVVESRDLADNYPVGLYRDISINNGIATLSRPVASITSLIDYTDGVITFDPDAGDESYSPASDINIYTVNTATGAIVRRTLSYLPTNTPVEHDFWFLPNNTGTQITHIFIDITEYP